MSTFTNHLRSGRALMWVKTHEETRVLTEYAAQLGKLKVKEGDKKYTAFTWDIAGGIREIGIKSGCLAVGEPLKDDNGVIALNDPNAVLKWFNEKAPENSVLFLKDYTPYLEKDFGMPAHVNRREIRNCLEELRPRGKVLVILSPDVNIPQELDKEINVIDYKLPTREELKIVLNSTCETVGTSYPSDGDAVIDAALGLTAGEAENAFSLSFVESKKFDPKIIRREKSAIVKKTGLLEVIESDFTMDDIGGLETLKAWLLSRKNCLTQAAIDFGIESIKGVFLAGVPGTGKSLTCKAVASMLGRPLLRFDMGRIMGSLVGESESNMRKCLEIAAAVAPCTLWIDEIEKGLSGVKAGSSQQDAHEVTKRVFGELLNFMQDRKAEVFLVATCNSIDSLPPELLRGGRSDALFWVDLPDAVQREEIIRIHLKRRKRNPKMFDAVMNQLVKASEGFTGAEIENWFQETLIRAFNVGKSDVELEDFLATAPEITLISKVMKNDIEQSRASAKARGAKDASKSHDAVKSPTVVEKRKITLN